MIRKQSTDHAFDQASVCLSDATHRNMNQKYVFFKKTLTSDRLFDIKIVQCLYCQVPENKCSLNRTNCSKNMVRSDTS